MKQLLSRGMLLVATLFISLSPSAFADALVDMNGQVLGDYKLIQFPGDTANINQIVNTGGANTGPVTTTFNENGMQIMPNPDQNMVNVSFDGGPANSDDNASSSSDGNPGGNAGFNNATTTDVADFNAPSDSWGMGEGSFNNTFTAPSAAANLNMGTIVNGITNTAVDTANDTFNDIPVEIDVPFSGGDEGGEGGFSD